MEQALFALQRLSAAVMAPFVLVHLGVILYAVRGGLSAAEILSRTRGNWGWIIFYSLFVVSASVHVPIGLRNVMIEWLRFSRHMATLWCLVIGVLLLVFGLRAVAAVGGL